MIAPTHIAFSVSLALLFGYSSPETLLLLSFGSAFPDVDHPKSFIGRLLPFLSVPLNRRFGHRGFIHSLILWILPCILGFVFFKPFGIFALGALSHIVLDTWNIAGVQMMKPVSEKIFVMAQKKYRIPSGSKKEYILLVILVFFVLLGNFILYKGGIRNILQKFIGDYTTAIQHYSREGKKICYLEGSFRKINGEILKDKFLIIGKDNAYNVTVLHEATDNIYRIPNDGEFIKCYLVKTVESWQTLKFQDPMTVQKGTCFYRVQTKWLRAKEGSVIAGDVLYLPSVEFEVTNYRYY